MDGEQIKSLIERIEKSEGADREIDALIYHDLLGFCRHARKVKTGAQSDTGFDCLDCGADSWGNKSREGGYPAGQGLHDSAPNYTASIDAALTLVPRGWIVEIRRYFNNEGEFVSAVSLTDSFTVGRGCDPEDEVTVSSRIVERRQGVDPTPLALCAAALRAKITLDADAE